LDADALRDYLATRIEGVEQGIALEQFPGGHSNLTYLLRAGGMEYVLRRAPLGPVAPKAHDMAREFAVLRAVAPHFAPAPDVYLCCEDATVIGAPFFLMERRRGVILRETSDPPDPETAERASHAVVEGLARLHAIDIVAKGLGSLGKPEGFVARQVTGWAERWRRAATEPDAAMDRVIAWLERRLPVSPQATLVHNDYKLDNVMLAEGGLDRLIAVLDWEMATVGDPLADLGLTLCYWGLGATATDRPAMTSRPGWYRRERVIAEYGRLAGRDVTQVGYYETLGVFKLAVILQQIYVRWLRGQTQDPRFSRFGERVRLLIDQAERLAEQHG